MLHSVQANSFVPDESIRVATARRVTVSGVRVTRRLEGTGITKNRVKRLW